MALDSPLAWTLIQRDYSEKLMLYRLELRLSQFLFWVYLKSPRMRLSQALANRQDRGFGAVFDVELAK